jgi:ribosomal protein S18 acetylase RimI-like enzyme
MLASPAHRLILALAGDRVVGMAAGALSLVPDKPPSFLLDELGVDADWRRRGIGRALVRAAMAEARAMGCSVLWVSTEGDNGPARALYRMLDGEEMTQVAVYSWGL